jgi:hypothetical protein
MMPWADRDRAIAYAKRIFPKYQEERGATVVHVVEIMTSETIFVLSAVDGRPGKLGDQTT